MLDNNAKKKNICIHFLLNNTHTLLRHDKAADSVYLNKMCMFYFNWPVLKKIKIIYSVWLLSQSHQVLDWHLLFQNHIWPPGCVYKDIWCQNVATLRKKGSYTDHHRRMFCLYQKPEDHWSCKCSPDICLGFIEMSLPGFFRNDTDLPYHS